MNYSSAKLLAALRIGKPQTHQGMTVVPILGPKPAGPTYLDLQEAIAQGKLRVTEIGDGGSVPELQVVNDSDSPVLMLDGEELIGAKQNRVLNTTVLLKPHSTTVIPVSCTERGRWSYSRPDFTDAGVVMSPSVRHHKMRSVSESLRTSRGHRSDQGLVWQEIDRLSQREGVASPTSAMHDVFVARRKSLSQLEKSFRLEKGQTAMLVLHAGQPVGFDYLSQPTVFTRLFPKLIRSYALDALSLEHKGRVSGVNKIAQSFLAQAAQLEGTNHPAVGYGTDIRFTGKGIVGSALVVDDQVIHAAFFAEPTSEHLPSMADSRRRRRFRES